MHMAYNVDNLTVRQLATILDTGGLFLHPDSDYSSNSAKVCRKCQLL